MKKVEGSQTLVRGTRTQLLQGQRFHRQSCPWPRAAPVSIAWLFRQLAKIKASLQPFLSTWRNKKWLTVNHNFFIWKKNAFHVSDHFNPISLKATLTHSLGPFSPLPSPFYSSKELGLCRNNQTSIQIRKLDFSCHKTALKAPLSWSPLPIHQVGWH